MSTKVMRSTVTRSRVRRAGAGPHPVSGYAATPAYGGHGDPGYAEHAGYGGYADPGYGDPRNPEQEDG
ncbi:hypothetical protein ACFSNO_10435 [Streptomyces cirratus]